jgi:hypothetical protein
VFFHYFEAFLREYEDRFEKEYGYFRPVIQDVVEKYLDCGNPMCGFARIRCPDCGEERLLFDESGGKVRYQYSRHGSQEESLDYLEFIARVTSHIPDKGQVMVRYYGLYSNAHRGKMRKAGTQPSHPPITDDDPTYVPAKGWAEMIRKVYEIDPLLCPSCGGKMSIISFIDDHRVVDKIISHLELTFEAERPPPPQVVQQELLMAAEEQGEYF